MAPVTSEHQDVSGFLLCVISGFVQERELGVIRTRPFQMKTGPRLPSRAPDLVFVGIKKCGRLRKYCLDGPADVVIEVAGTESRALDRGDKFFEYEQGGVREYWLVDPERKCAEFYWLARDKRFDTVRVGDDGIFRSAVLKGLWLDVGWL
jgi:Uma2 family endonuclease